MQTTLGTPATGAGPIRWQAIVARYQNADVRRSLWQIVNSAGPYLLLWTLMVHSLTISYWLTLALAVPAALFLMRVFIILHDCGHGSFFGSTKVNDWVGSICGVLTFTPYFRWRRNHAIHHATSGDLERRQTGDILTLTVNEYLALSKLKRLGYRLYRNPVLLFLIFPFVLFFIAQRFASPQDGRRERRSVLITNLALLAIVIAASLTIGLKAYLLVQMPVLYLAALMGVWLFYIQHQFEDTYWEHHPDWDYALASLQGSSYYKLPKVLQWFTGNIGFHHIHHLSPKIPNYYLEKSYVENPLFQQVTTITLWESFSAASLKLWDEASGKMVGWAHLKDLALL